MLTIAWTVRGFPNQIAKTLIAYPTYWCQIQQYKYIHTHIIIISFNFSTQLYSTSSYCRFQ